MNEAKIKQERTNSILKEIIPKALASLNDTQLSSLCVTDVTCHKGRHDADVYLDKMMFDQDEQNEILRKLKKVASHLQRECALVAGWYKSPKFHFHFDKQLEQQNHIDSLFKKIEKELQRDKDG